MAQVVFLEARASVPVVDYLADQRRRIDAGLPHDPIAVVLQVAEDAAEEAEHVDMYCDALSELGVEPKRGEDYEDAAKRRAKEIDDRDDAICDAIRDGFDVEIEANDTPNEIREAISDRAEKLKAWTKALIKGLETFGVDVDDGGEDVDYTETAIAEGSARYEAMRNALNRHHGIDVTDRMPKEIDDAIAALTTKPKAGDLDAPANDTSAAEIETLKATIAEREAANVAMAEELREAEAKLSEERRRSQAFVRIGNEERDRLLAAKDAEIVEMRVAFQRAVALVSTVDTDKLAAARIEGYEAAKAECRDEIDSYKRTIATDVAALATLRATIANLETEIAEEKRARAAARTAGYSDSTSEIATLRAYVKGLETQIGRLTIGIFRVAETKTKAERTETAKRIANEGAEK